MEQEEERLRLEAKEKERLEKLKKTQADQKEDGMVEKHKENMKGGEKKKEVDVEGKWKKHQAQQLPDDVDDVIKTLNDCDFGI